MNTNFAKLGEQIYLILSGEYRSIQSWNEAGLTEPDPKKATRFVVSDPRIIVHIDRDTNSIDAQCDESVVHGHGNVIDQIKNIAEQNRVDFDYNIIGRKIRPKTESLNEKSPYYFKVSPNVPWTPTLRPRTSTRPIRKIRRQEGVRVALSMIDGEPVYHVVMIKNRDPSEPTNKPVITSVSAHDSRAEAQRKAKLYALSNNLPILEGVVNMPALIEGFDEYDYPEHDDQPDIKSGGYVRDTQDHTGEVFRMVGDPQDRRVQILDRHGQGWSIAPHRLVAVPAGDPGIQKYFSNSAHDDLDEITGISEFATLMQRMPGAEPKMDSRISAAVSEQGIAEGSVLEGFGHMLGSTKTSYQPLDGVKIIVRHKAAVSEEVRGSRSRNIKEIFIQRGDERFRMRENNLNAARAMARHVHGGGEVYDSIGQAINEMATEYRSLNNFVRYVSRSGMVNETNQEYVTLAQKRVQNIREAFRKLQGAKTYASAVENLNQDRNVELTETDLDLESKFSSVNCDARVTQAMSSVRQALAREAAFERAIQEAIADEDFSSIKHKLNEQDAVTFASPEAKLSYQVSQFSALAQNARLGSYLGMISKKISEGQDLESFERKTLRLCLERARAKPRASKPSTMRESREYLTFLDKFDPK